jgi:hypothetical protein
VQHKECDLQFAVERDLVRGVVLRASFGEVLAAFQVRGEDDFPPSLKAPF